MIKKRSRGEAGQLEQKIREDSTKYKSMEVAHAICEGLGEQIEECARKHHDVINEPEFFIVMLLGDDPVLSTVIRRKFYAWPFMPQPRPNQSVWIYRKAKQEIELVWVLPEPATMAYLSSTLVVHDQYKRMKRWCDYFYNGDFAERIRQEYKNPGWLTESEYLKRNFTELSKALGDKSKGFGAKPFDLSEVSVGDVPEAIDAVLQQKRLDSSGKAKNA